jgi:hypothetical protein
MANWLTKIVVGEGNVIRERSFTNWNTFDASEVVAAKEREKEKASADKSSARPPANSNEDSDPPRD